MTLSPEDRRALAEAKRRLERRGLLVTLVDKLGKPIEKGLELLPESAARVVQAATRESLERALRVALTTLRRRERTASSDRGHRLASAASGAIGGWFGLAGLSVELPVTTVLMLRSIADVARSEGHDLADVEVQLACLEVFALGGPSDDDDAADTGYFAVRAALAAALSDAARHVALHGASLRGAPALLRLLERLAVRFGVVVQDKVLLEAAPVVGAAGGALVNTVFLTHFQELARGHFAVKRLEQRYGAEAVQAAYGEV
ncbi:MAG: EcsC family protein [Planctomycetota bacterium]